MILRAKTIDRRTDLCKRYGFRAVIVYEQKPGIAACDHRIKVKEFLARRYGQPMCQTYNKTWVNTDSKWFAARTGEGEYTIAVKDARLLDWLLLL